MLASYRILAIVISGLLGCCAGSVAFSDRASAAPPNPSQPSAAPINIPALIGELNAERYDVRQRARARLEQLATQSEYAGQLSAECQRALAQTETPVETRSVLSSLASRLPQAKVSSSAPASVGALEELLDDLDADSFAVREGSAVRLADHLQHPERIGFVLEGLKRRQALPTLSLEARRRVEPLVAQARQVWLLSDPKASRLPAIGDSQLDAWVRQLELPEPADVKGSLSTHALAEQELLDALARDDCLARVQSRLEQRLADAGLEDEARKRLTKVLDWTRPAMVAECWRQGHHTSIQHLLIDVPSQAPGAQRPSHFDRCDDRVAHCVSGNSLSPGDYPVGVLFPHPTALEACFHLVNLPTPRARMAYEVYKHTDERKRLIRISERTCAALLATGKPLSVRELLMLEWLDASDARRTAAKLLTSLDDQKLEYGGARPVPTGPFDSPIYAPLEPLVGPVSHHGLLCLVLGKLGTDDDLTVLRKVVEKKRCLSATDQAPFQMPWIAMLMIASRSQEPATNEWLASVAERDEPLGLDEPEGAELGAAAAAIVLQHAGESLSAHGLEAVEDEVLAELHCPAYRFVDAQRRAAFVRWWAARQRPLSRR